MKLGQVLAHGGKKGRRTRDLVVGYTTYSGRMRAFKLATKSNHTRRLALQR